MMLNKYKDKIMIFCIGFLIYFIIGCIISYYINGINFWNALFDLDTPRVFGDLAIKDFNHYRTAVHPLFVIFFQPIINILTKIIKNPYLAIITFQSFLSSTSLVLFYSFLKKISKNFKLIYFFLTLFGFSFGQILFSTAFETYIYAQFFLIVLWLFALYNIDKDLSLWSYIFLVLLGVFSIGVTLTNYVQFFIVVLFLICFNKNIKKRYIKTILVLIIPIFISVFFANIQNIIWPSAPNFFTEGISDIIYGNSEEKLYTNFNITFNNIKYLINCNIAYDFNLFSSIVPYKGSYITFANSTISNILSYIIFTCFILINIFYIIKIKFNINKHKIYFALNITFIFNFCFHIIYGNATAFIYICHYNFILLLTTFIIIDSLPQIKSTIINYLFIILSFSYIFLALKNIIKIINYLFIKYNTIDYVKYYPFILIAVVLIIIILLLAKNRYLKIILIVITCIMPYFAHKYINRLNWDNYCYQNCDTWQLENNSLIRYKKQLKDVKNQFMVTNFIDTNNNLGIYYFGMGIRPKILYKDGKLVDITTGEQLYSFDYKEELIVPNDYLVLLKTKENKIIKIFENENGIYIQNIDKLVTIYEDKTQPLVLSNFEDHKYSNVLKVLQQEVLFNITSKGPYPNIIGYDKVFYCDAMLGTMVLEYTNNVNLITKWAKSITSIYDYARGSQIKEPDNLGELLYILGATKTKNKVLVNKILDEIKTLSNGKDYICGSVDFSNQCYYPTAVALYGARRFGVNIDLKLPNVDDGYAKLTWYYNKNLKSSVNISNNLYPYLNWAMYNYQGYGSLYMLDEIYPLSYEAGSHKNVKECNVSIFYCEKGAHLSHLWHASEMFMLLKDY